MLGSREVTFQSADRFRKLKTGLVSPLGKAVTKAFKKTIKKARRKRHNAATKERKAKLRLLKKDPAFRQYLRTGIPQPALPARKERYREYLRSDHWLRFRASVLKKRGLICEQCNTQQVSVDLHHLTYVRLGEERESDVEVLCRDCHKIRHGIQSPNPFSARLTRGQRHEETAAHAERSSGAKSSMPPQQQAGR